jgi:hypothetical protein
MNVHCLQITCYAVPHNNHYTLLLENISFYFIQEQVFFLHSSLSFLFPSSHSLFHTFIFEKDCTLLQCCYKGCIQSNQQLALRRLMHSSSTIFQYQVLERRLAQETLTGCAGLHTIELEGTEHSPVCARKIHFTYLLYVGRSHDYLNLTMLQIRNVKIGDAVEWGREIT